MSSNLDPNHKGAIFSVKPPVIKIAKVRKGKTTSYYISSESQSIGVSLPEKSRLKF